MPLTFAACHSASGHSGKRRQRPSIYNLTREAPDPAHRHRPPHAPGRRLRRQALVGHVQFLADDKLEGRNVGTPGYERPSTTSKPVQGDRPEAGRHGRLPAAGANSNRASCPPSSRSSCWSVTARRNRWSSGQDATLNARGELDGSIEAPMVFIGYGLSIPEAGWDDLAGRGPARQDRGLRERVRAGEGVGQRQVARQLRPTSDGPR